MATPRRTKTTTIKEEIPEGFQLQSDPASTGQQTPIDETSLEFSERLQQIRTQLGAGSDDIQIKVYRIVQGKNPGFCFSDKAVDEEMIQRRCGAGSYQCRVIAGGAVVEVIDVEIDAASVAPIDTKQNGNDPVIALLMQQNAQLMQAFTTMIANGGQNQSQPSMLDMVNTLKGLKDLSGGGDASAMKMFEKGIDLATKIGGFGEKSWTTELFETIKEVAAPVLPALLQNVNGKQTPNPQQLQAAEMTPEQQQETYLRQAIAGIKQQALANVPVGLVLEWIENHASEYANLIRIVVTSDFSTIAKLDPEIAGSEPLSTYFKTLYDGLRSAYQESATLDDDTGGESGDEENDSENGTVSAPIVVESNVIHTGNQPRKRSRN